MISRILRRSIFVGAIVTSLVMPAVAHAQEATVSGTVIDSTGGVLPGVTIKAVNAASGNSFEAVTDSRGAYLLAARIGTYQITATLAGFGTVYVFLGLTAASIGQPLRDHQVALTRVSGAILLAMALFLIGSMFLRAPWLYREKRFHPQLGRYGAAAPVVAGVAFGFGWSPCLGPILGSILGIAGSQQRVWAACQLTTVDWRANAAVVPALLKAARLDPSAMVRVTCVRCLEQMDVKSADVTATLEVLKADKDSIVRGEVDYALNKLKSTK